MTDSGLEEAWEGEYKFVPNGAYIVFPKETVQELFQHGHPGSTRKTMSKYSPGMVIGWEVDEVTVALEEYDPGRNWPRTKGARTRTHEKATRKLPENRRNSGTAEADATPEPVAEPHPSRRDRRGAPGARGQRREDGS